MPGIRILCDSHLLWITCFRSEWAAKRNSNRTRNFANVNDKKSLCKVSTCRKKLKVVSEDLTEQRNIELNTAAEAVEEHFEVSKVFRQKEVQQHIMAQIILETVCDSDAGEYHQHPVTHDETLFHSTTNEGEMLSAAVVLTFPKFSSSVNSSVKLVVTSRKFLS